MDYAYWLRVINCLLAGGVIGLCFLKAKWDYHNRARNSRVFGLGLLCIALAWQSLAFRYDRFNPRVPLITVGLVFCLYGMRHTAAGETGRIRKK